MFGGKLSNKYSPEFLIQDEDTHRDLITSATFNPYIVSSGRRDIYPLHQMSACIYYFTVIILRAFIISFGF